MSMGGEAGEEEAKPKGKQIGTVDVVQIAKFAWGEK